MKWDVSSFNNLLLLILWQFYRSCLPHSRHTSSFVSIACDFNLFCLFQLFSYMKMKDVGNDSMQVTMVILTLPTQNPQKETCSLNLMMVQSNNCTSVIYSTVAAIRRSVIEVPMRAMLLFLPLLNGQTLLSGQYTFPQGWPFSRGWTIYLNFQWHFLFTLMSTTSFKETQ